MQNNDLTAAKRRYKFLCRERDTLTLRNEHDDMIDNEIEKLEAAFPEIVQNDKRNIAKNKKSTTNAEPAMQTIDAASSITKESNQSTSTMLYSKSEAVTDNEKANYHSMEKLEHEEEPQSELLHSCSVKANSEEKLPCKTNTRNEEAIVNTKENINNNNANENEVNSSLTLMSKHSETVSENSPSFRTRSNDNNIVNPSNDVCRSDRNEDYISNVITAENNNKSRLQSKHKAWMKGRNHDLNLSQGANFCHVYSSNAVSITMFSLKVYNEMQKPSVFTRFCFWVLIVQTLLIALLHRYVISPSHPPGSYCLPSLFCLLTHITLILWIRNTQPRCLSLPMMVVYVFLDILPSFVFVLVMYVVFMNVINLTSNAL